MSPLPFCSTQSVTIQWDISSPKDKTTHKVMYDNPEKTAPIHTCIQKMFRNCRSPGY